jgi:hypothetical protein
MGGHLKLQMPECWEYGTGGTGLGRRGWEDGIGLMRIALNRGCGTGLGIQALRLRLGDIVDVVGIV